MTTHTTPGPWAASKNPDNKTSWFAGPAIITGEFPSNPKRDEANARLIASAPQLLEALCYVKQYGPALESYGALNIVNRAIARAEQGDTP